MPRVFISYSHDSPLHGRRIRALADQLRADGNEAWIDQYVQDPEEGWIAWMRRQVKRAEKVLLVFTETYQRRFEGDEEEGKGLGATFEGVIVTQALYDSGGRNAKFRPVVFTEEDASFIPSELRRFNRYSVDTPENYQALLRWLHEAPLIVAPSVGQMPDLPPEPALEPLFPDQPAEPRRPLIQRVASPGNATEKGQLALLRRRVEWAWVKEVLEKSLFGRALVELGMEARDDALEQPWKRLVELPDHTRRALPTQTRAWDVYRECGNALLILGAPGSGKTTTLLELARSLIAATEADDNEPVPVVLSLSTWANKRLPLAQWAAEELRARYRVPIATGRQWLAQGQLILLLDGLDEVPERHRAACLQAVKAYDLPLPGLVVCSRLEEYLALPARLNLSAAVCLQPLDLEQADGWLAQAGLTGLQEAVRNNADWRELLRTPLMLSVASLAFAGSGPGPLSADPDRPQSLEARRTALFDRYIERMFTHRVCGGESWPREKILRWLGWLARSTLERAQSAILIENLQPDLLRGVWRWAYVVASRLPVVFALGGFSLGGFPSSTSDFFYFVGLLAMTLLFGTAIIVFDGLALCGWLPLPKSALAKKSLSLVTQYGGFLALLLILWIPLKHLFDLKATGLQGHQTWIGGSPGNQILLTMAIAGLVCWLVVGMEAGLRPADADVQPVTGIAWSAKKALKWTLIASVLGFIVLFICGLVTVGWSYDELPLGVFQTFGFAKGVSKASAIVAVGVAGALIGGLLGFVFGGWIGRLHGKAAFSPNQGVRSSLALSLRMGLVGLGLTALLGGPSWIASGGVGIPLGMNGVLVASYFAAAFGGQDVIRHAVLRTLLAWRGGWAPLRYVRFLNHAVDLAFLQPSGGAYLFIHRTFQEHLAAGFGNLSADEAEFLRRGLEAQKKRATNALEAAQRLAQTEAARAKEADQHASEQKQATSKLRRRAVAAAGAAGAALLLLVIAGGMWLTATKQGVMLINQGDVLGAQGKLPEALEAYQKGLAIAKRLADQDRSNAGWQRELAVDYSKVGDALRTQGKLPEALEAYQQSLAFTKRLADQDRSNAGWQQDFAASHGKVGDVLGAQGKLAEALEAHQQELAIMLHLAEHDPSNPGCQQELAVGYANVGDVLSAQGKLPEALGAYQAGLNIWQRLADQDKSNLNRQRALMSAKLLLGAKVVITEVISGSPAEKLGLRVGDVLLVYDGRKVLNYAMFSYMVASSGDGARTLRVRRAGQEVTFSVPPGRLGIRLTNGDPAEP